MTNKLIYTKLEPLRLPAKEALEFERKIAEVEIELLPGHYLRRPKASDLVKKVAKPVYERIACKEFTFVFKCEEDYPDILHIYARHLTTPNEVINLFFGYTPVWNEEFKRFENHSDTHVLYWFWRDESKKVIMTISCFQKTLNNHAKPH